jgi:hypothetical protein
MESLLDVLQPLGTAIELDVLSAEYLKSRERPATPAQARARFGCTAAHSDACAVPALTTDRVAYAESELALAMPGRGRSRIVILRDGASVKLRPIAPEDKPLLVDVFERLSAESRYRRFFTNLRELSHAALAYLTEAGAQED